MKFVTPMDTTKPHREGTVFVITAMNRDDKECREYEGTSKKAVIDMAKQLGYDDVHCDISVHMRTYGNVYVILATNRFEGHP